MPRKVSFLPAFFVALAIVFGIAVILRVRALSTQPAERLAGVTSAQVDPARTQRPDSASPVDVPVRAETGTIVETAPATATSASARTRAQRFQDLLRAALPGGDSSKPAVAAPPPAAVTATIAPPKPAPQRAPRPAPANRPPAAPGSQASSGGSGGGSEASKAKADPDDPNSDDTAPQLVSVEFTPQQVRDGEETTMVVVATDNLSGVRSISGSIASPSGALQGFSVNREVDTNRWTAKITVPKDAAEGVWRVNYLSMADNASNSVNLAGGGALPGNASFRVVSSRPDSTGPTLKAIWMQRPSMRAGEKNTIFVTAEDDKSGVTLISGVFHSPSKTARIGFACRAAESGAWECDVNPPTCLDCGEWKLEQLQMQDKAHNMTMLRQENQLVAATRLDIVGEQCDSMQPELSSLVLDRTVVTNQDITTINVIAVVSDDACGIASLSGQAVGPPSNLGQSRLYISFKPSGPPNTWVGQLVVPRLASKGTWTVSWMQILDKGQNLKTYAQGDPALGNASFRVQ